MLDEGSAIHYKAQLLQIECEMQGMIVANKEREAKGLALAYGEESFFALVNQIQKIRGYYS